MIFSLTFPWHVTDDQSRLLCSCRLHNLKRILIHTTSIKSACYWKLQTSSLICSLTKIFCHANYYCIILIVFRGFCPIMEQRSNFLCSFFSLCNIFRYPLLLHASTVPIISSFNFLLVRIFIIANFPNFQNFFELFVIWKIDLFFKKSLFNPILERDCTPLHWNYPAIWGKMG